MWGATYNPLRVVLLWAALLPAAASGQPSAVTPTPLSKAADLYHRTEYKQALDILKGIKSPDSAILQLMGQVEYGLGEYKQSTDTFERALDVLARAKGSPILTSELYAWLGRAYGRRAETSFPLMAPRYASKAREAFETAVKLNGSNHEAVDDLFEYYLQAPGFLGGGLDKAEVLAKHIADLDATWGQRAAARVTEERKDYPGTEQHLRKAMDLAPKQVGRIVDLAKYLANRGRTQESDAMFEQATKLAPNNPDIMFAQAHTFVDHKRNLNQARALLRRFLASPLTPENPSREDAQALLKKIEAAIQNGSQR
ncbi:MAG: tetratricopeptide repeat-containing protein [Acidobacteriota bacterium]